MAGHSLVTANCRGQGEEASQLIGRPLHRASRRLEREAPGWAGWLRFRARRSQPTADLPQASVELAVGGGEPPIAASGRRPRARARPRRARRSAGRATRVGGGLRRWSASSGGWRRRVPLLAPCVVSTPTYSRLSDDGTWVGNADPFPQRTVAAVGTSRCGSQSPWSPCPLTNLERQPWRVFLGLLLFV